MKLLLSLFAFLLFFKCDSHTLSKNDSPIEEKITTIPIPPQTNEEKEWINPTGTSVEQRVLVPKNYQRVKVAENTFASYLRQLPLKPHGKNVLYFNGEEKPNEGIYVAVVDLPIGKRDLHQCADAVMRLRAEYLYEQRQYDAIHFNFTNGFKAAYKKWRAGNRIRVEGNDVYWKPTDTASNDYEDFWKYLEMVFSYAGTYSLAKELHAKAVEDMQIGDVFIQGGFPGHAVIVMDMAKDPTTGKQLFLLAQSYMPAQELHILENPNNSALSPWYALDFDNSFLTPEWTFYEEDLKQF